MTYAEKDRRDLRITLYVVFGAIMLSLAAFSPDPSKPRPSCATGRVANAWTANRSTLLNLRNQEIQNAAHASDAAVRVPLLITEREDTMRRVDSTYRERFDMAVRADSVTGCR